MQISSSVAPRSYPGYVLCAPAGDYGSSDPLAALTDGWAKALALDEGEPEPEPTSGEHRREAEEDPNEPEEDDSHEEEDADGEEESEDAEEESDEDDEESEAESEEDDDSDEEGDEDDGKRRSDKSLDDATKVKVTVNGQEQEVSLSELRAGYSRTQDYTQKTQQVAQQRRQLQEAEDQTEQVRQGWLQHLQQLEDAAKARRQLYSQAELQRLKQEDTYAYGQALEQQRELDDQLGKIQRAREATQQESQQQTQRQRQRALQAEFEQLQSKLPEWQDPETRSQELETINKYAKDLGFGDQEIGGIADHRLYIVLRDAARYRASQQRAAETKTKVTAAKKQAKVKSGNLKPGKAQTPSSRSTARSKQKQQRFHKTGDVRDAASWIEDQFL